MLVKYMQFHFLFFFCQEYQVLHEKYMALKKSYSEQEMVGTRELMLLLFRGCYLLSLRIHRLS